jgi:antirestriction protein ArdC
MPLDLHQRLTQTILQQLDTADPGSWICPWHNAGGLPQNARTNRSYRGINILSLWCRAESAGYADPRWATYKQWSDLGAQVRRGEKGTLVIFYKDRQQGPGHADGSESDEGKGDCGQRFIARASFVFNAAQVENAPEPPALSSEAGTTASFDNFVTNTGATIRIGGDRACYVPGEDMIRMPPRERFRSTHGYVATLAHELVHWSGAKHRLNRDLSTRVGSRSYAAEELVAELGSAFILAGLHLAREPHPQHARYMAGWLPLLRADPRALSTAAAQASRAADYLSGLQADRTCRSLPQNRRSTTRNEPSLAKSGGSA